MWNNKLKFNGFFFAVNLELIAPAAYDERNLFDPGNIMVKYSFIPIYFFK